MWNGVFVLFSPLLGGAVGDAMLDIFLGWCGLRHVLFLLNAWQESVVASSLLMEEPDARDPPR